MRNCTFAGCNDEPWYRVESQWTIADFDTELVCDEHYLELLRQISNTFVDDMPPVICVYTLWFEDEKARLSGSEATEHPATP